MPNEDPVLLRAIDAYVALQTEVQRQSAQFLQFIQERSKVQAVIKAEPTLRERIAAIWEGYPPGMRLVAKQIAKELDMKPENRALVDELAAMKKDGILGNDYPHGQPGYYLKSAYCNTATVSTVSPRSDDG